MYNVNVSTTITHVLYTLMSYMYPDMLAYIHVCAARVNAI